MLTSPCSNCPFRTDIPPYLSQARAKEIAAALYVKGDPSQGGVFPCHETTEFVPTGEYGEEELRATARSKWCAGSLILMEKQGVLGLNQMARIWMRMRMLNPDRLMLDAPVFGSFKEWIRAQPSRRA